MKTITVFEEAKEKKQTTRELGINHTLYWAYRNSQEAGNDTINFDDVIWEEDIEPIVEALRAYEFETVTITSNFSGLITTLAELTKLGCTIQGMAEVKSRHKDFMTGEQEKLPALVIKI